MPSFKELQQPANRPKFTGKRLVMYDTGATHKTISKHAWKASLKFAAFSDYRSTDEDFTRAFDEADGIVFEHFGIVVINEDREKQVLMVTESLISKNRFIYSKPERCVYALTDDLVP